MKGLLLKLTTENTSILHLNIYKQIDGCTMGRPLSVISSGIDMTKTEEEVVKLNENETKWYKWNAINADLNRVAQVVSTFTEDEYFYWGDTNN